MLVNGVHARSMSSQPSSSGRWAPFISPHRPWPSVASHRSGSSRSRNSRNWRTCHVGDEPHHVLHPLAADLAATPSSPRSPSAASSVLDVRRRPTSPTAPSWPSAENARSRRHRIQCAVSRRSSDDGQPVPWPCDRPLEDAQRYVLERVLAARRRSTIAARRRRRAGAGRPTWSPARTCRRSPTRAVDGYAVRAADVADAPVELRVVGELAAGAAPTDRVRRAGRGDADHDRRADARRAPTPSVMVEDTERLDGDRVRLARAGARRRGACAAPATTSSAGDRAVHGRHRRHARPSPACWPASTPGTVLVHPPATRRRAVDRRRAGRRRLAAARRARSASATGRCSLALLAEAGCEAVDLGVVRDDEAALEAVLRDAAATCDAIVTSGGVSMGDFDVVKAVLDRIADMRWMQIAIKPAKPFAFGTASTARAGLRAAGQPGQLAGQLRAVRPARRCAR